MTYYYNHDGVFQKESSKEYKTEKGAIDKMAKEGRGAVYDETGKLISNFVKESDVPDGALEENADGSVNGYDDEGNQIGTIDTKSISSLTGENAPPEEDSEDKNDTASQEEQKPMMVQTTVDSIYVRSKPDTKSAIMGYINETVKEKRQYEVTEFIDGWGFVPKKDGWIALAYTKQVD